MKQNIKRIWLMLCMAVCLFALTGCTEEENNQYQMTQEEEGQLMNSAQSWFDTITRSDDAVLDELQLRAQHFRYHAISEGVNAWRITRDEVGALNEVTSIVPAVTDDGYSCVIEAVYENGPMECTIFFDLNMRVTSMSFVQDSTFQDKMVRAGLNTALGMGTVFVVLIFISMLIGCFKYINAWEISRQAKQTAAVPAVPAPATAAAVIPMVEAAEELVDDLELVAVITAAIAASTGASADGLVVRSIRRASGSKWKKA